MYQKKGLWEADINKALDHGEWTGGKELVLLTAGVAEETLQTTVGGNRKFTRLKQLLAM